MLNSPTKIRVLWACLLSLFAITVVITIVLLRSDAKQEGEDEVSIALLENQSIVQPSDLPVQNDSSLASTEIETNQNLNHPREICKQVFGTLSDQCFESLNTYFLDRPYVLKNFDWLPLPLTYRRIFDNPEVDRSNVIEALADPNCRLEQGEVRWDLKEACHAESIANYSNFMYLCKDLDRNWELELLMVRTLWESPRYQPTVKHRYIRWNTEPTPPSSWAGERYLEGRWIVESVCKQYDIAEFELKEEHYRILESIGRRLGDKERAFSRTYEVMKSLAARLGDEWASFVYESSSTSDEWGIHESNVMPWKSLLNEMWWALYISRATSREHIRTTALRYGIQAWNELEKTGVKIDLDKLVEYVCGPIWRYSTENCQDSLSVLQRSDETIDQGFWHALSKFEARSIELNLYDIEIENRGLEWELDAIRATDPDATRRKLSEIANSRDEL